jgi:hypothetical protein
MMGEQKSRERFRLPPRLFKLTRLGDGGGVAHLDVASGRVAVPLEPSRSTLVKAGDIGRGRGHLLAHAARGAHPGRLQEARVGPAEGVRIGEVRLPVETHEAPAECAGGGA